MLNLVFTLYTLQTPKEIINTWRLIKQIGYCIVQQERCPTTGKLHLQGYMELTRSYDNRTLFKKLGVKMHIETRKGTQKDAIEYCSKNETRTISPESIGIPKESKQGQRFNPIIDQIRKNDTLFNIADTNPEQYIRYHRGIKELRSIYLNRIERKEPPIVTVLIGKPGIGKTRHIYQVHPYNDIYRLSTSNSSNLWFDGYDPIQHKVLLIDDFKGWISYQKMLQLIDRYTLQVEYKGGMIPLLVSHIYITTNFEIEDWYPSKNDITALTRRINIIKRLAEGLDPSVLSDSVHIK